MITFAYENSYQLLCLILNMDDIAFELTKLHMLSGAEFSRQVVSIAKNRAFHPLNDNDNIFVVGGEKAADYNALLQAARK